MNFRYTILYADDVPASLDFFARAFGFTIGFMHEGQDYGELVTGTTKLAFAATSLQRDLGKTPLAATASTPTFELAFETDDVAAAVEQAVAAGARLVQAAHQQPWGQTSAYVSDPNGYLIELCSPVTPPG